MLGGVPPSVPLGLREQRGQNRMEPSQTSWLKSFSSAYCVQLGQGLDLCHLFPYWGNDATRLIGFPQRSKGIIHVLAHEVDCGHHCHYSQIQFISAVTWEHFAGLKFVFTSRRVGDEKRNVGFVSPRHPCAACGGRGTLCLSPGSHCCQGCVRAVTVPGAERLQGQQSDPRRVWKS